MRRRRSQTAHSTSGHEEGITGISVRGYKSLAKECSIQVRPLTILSGANSSGKSSALQPLLLLKQTLETTYDPGALLINGPNVQFTSAEEQLLSRLDRRRHAANFMVGLEIDNEQSLTETFNIKPTKGVELSEMLYGGRDENYALRPSMAADEVEAVLPKEVKEFEKTFIEMLEEEGDVQWRVRQNKCFLSFELQIVSNDRRASFATSMPGFNPGGPFESYIRDIIHVPGLRGNPERTYKTAAVGPQFTGTFNNYVASVINHWGENRTEQLSKLGQHLRTLGLTSRVEARQLDDVQVELLVGRLPRSSARASDMVSIADVGFGVSQTLPVLVALLVAKPGQLVYLEQPEIHLHPRAQFAMSQLLAEASRRGVRVVVETHSDLLLLGIQTLIAEGQLDPDIVKLHWFSRLKNGSTQVSSHDVDETGAFGDWPEDFSQIKLEAEGRYLDAVESQQVKK